MKKKLFIPYNRATTDDLEKSGITPEIAGNAGIEELEKTTILRRYGISAEGYFIPYRDGFGRVKLTKIYNWPEGKRRPKYMQARNTSPEPYFSPLVNNWEAIFNNTSENLIFVEGEKKAITGISGGYYCVGLGGVWCWRSKGKPLSQWEMIKFLGRHVYIVFDSDIVDKSEVQRAEREFAAYLKLRGANVKRIRLPDLCGDGNKTGLDDFLVHHGFPENIEKSRAAFDTLPREDIDTSVSYLSNDDGNAQRLVDAYGDNIQWVTDWKKWIAYNSATGLWSVDKNGEVMRYARTISSMIMEDAKNVSSDESRRKILSWSRTSGNESRLKAMINIAASNEGMSITSAELDVDLWAAATGDGMAVDLLSGLPRAVRRDDYFTKKLGTIFLVDAKCTLWKQFLNEIFGGDLELIRFVQWTVGYALTGSNDEQCVFLSWGQGKNGKSTFMDVIRALFGDYSIHCSSETFMARRGESIRSDIARLQGARLITSSEVEQGKRFAESLIKEWTGGESITARKLYSNEVEFKPQGKLWIGTNYKPKIYGTEDAIWRRIRLIPFLVTISAEKRDPELASKLKAELPGILNWALEGCLAWQERKDLCPPKAVIAATAEYRAEMDIIGAWVAQNCIEDSKRKERVGELYQDYSQWCDANGHKAASQLEFTKRMHTRYEKIENTTDRATERKGTFFKGLALITPAHKSNYK